MPSLSWIGPSSVFSVEIVHFLRLPLATAWKYAVLASPFNTQFTLLLCLQYSSSYA